MVGAGGGPRSAGQPAGRDDLYIAMKFNSNIINCAIMNNFKLSYDALVGHEINTANGVSLNDKIKNVIMHCIK